MSAEDQPETTHEEAAPETADVADQTVELPEETAVGTVPAPQRLSPLQRITGQLRRHWVAALAAVVAASMLAAGSVYWWVYRPDRLTDTAAREQMLDAARVATEALLSYSPDNVDANVADAKSRLTGDFLQRYSEFADTVVVPAAKQRGVKTEANVARAAVSRMDPDSAQVLAFVNQVTTSRERPTPALATSSVMMSLVRVDGHWLIAEFTPI